MSRDDEWDGEVLRRVSSEWAERVIFLPECGSTNDEARGVALKGGEGPAVILTERQTAGRGRRGQPWSCPPEEGIAFSLMLRPDEPTALWSRCALAAGLAVAEGLDAFGLFCGVKWPNDVWVGGKKICGILVEAGADFVVVGVGINVNVEAFPDGLAHPATSVLLETGQKGSREEVLVSCLQRLRLRLAQIGSGFDDLLSAWSERCVLTGKNVRLETGEGEKRGKVRGVSSQGELLLMTGSGLEKILQANEIRLLE